VTVKDGGHARLGAAASTIVNRMTQVDVRFALSYAVHVTLVDESTKNRVVGQVMFNIPDPSVAVTRVKKFTRISGRLSL
jgi:hypothetical protein